MTQCAFLEILHRRLTLTQISEYRGGDEDGGVGADGDSHEQREAEVEQCARTEQEVTDEQDGRDRQESHDGGVDRADQRLVDRLVGGL